MHSSLYSRFLRQPFEVEFMRWVLVLIFLMFGYTKWFDYEAQALIPLISNSPLLSWMYGVFGIQGASYALGTAEWAIGLSLAIGAWSSRVTLIAAAASSVTYLTTASLLLTTPGGWEASAGGFPAMGGATSFLIKDLVLMAGSLVLLKNAAQQLTARAKQTDREHAAF
ncbi:YkgB family protein [Pseudomonas sp. O64]|uniref:YkgB family protein n=1 Tax=unclassified Pseudomonas TaxID=196821 RepID=UPI00387B5141